jgi:hypothetical protein
VIRAFVAAVILWPAIGRADIDWGKGLVTAPGIGLAGGTVKDKLGDPAVKDRVDAAVAGAFVIAADPETDGSWKVTMAVGLDAIRQAVAGGPRQLAASDDAPAAAIVEGAAVTPALGYTIGGLAAATVFVTEPPAWAKGAPRIKAKAVKGAAIEADVGKATAATLFLVIGKK